MPDAATSSTASACGEISRASLTGRIGGESISTNCSWERSSRRTERKRMWSISVGSGGIGPLVSTDRLRHSVGCGATSASESTISVDRPCPLGRPKIWCWRGARRSASTITVGMPSCPSATPRLAITVDLPCPGSELVT